MDRPRPLVPLMRAARRWADAVSGRARAMPARVRCEQAVYGSYDGGYAIGARTPGWTREQLQAFERACQGLGERPPHVSAEGLLIARQVVGGAWLIVRAGELGRDDRGRPGALSFHAFLMSDRDYRRIGAAPFPLVASLEACHRRGPQSITPLVLAVTPFPARRIRAPEHQALVDALMRGAPVAVEAEAPANELARGLWMALPPSVRAERSLSTWVFTEECAYDFRARPTRLPMAQLLSAQVCPDRIQ